MYLKKITFPFSKTQLLINRISAIDSFKGKWRTLEKRESKYLKELKRIAPIESSGSSTRIEGAILTDDEIEKLLKNLKSPLIHEVRGRGLMLGVELRHPDGNPAGDVAAGILSEMLQRGMIMLADGPSGNVLAFTPPFGLSDEEMVFVVDQIQRAL